MAKSRKSVGKTIGRLILALVGLLVLAIVVIAVRYLVWKPDPMTAFYRGQSLLVMGHRGAPRRRRRTPSPLSRQPWSWGLMA